MHHNFLDNESHARESLSIDRIPPDSVFINLMDPIYQTYQIIHSCFGAATSHFIVESAQIGQTSKSIIQSYNPDKGSFGIEGKELGKNIGHNLENKGHQKIYLSMKITKILILKILEFLFEIFDLIFGTEN